MLWLNVNAVFWLHLQLGVVQTEGGSVQGQNTPLGLFRSVEVFKGIPFAARPGTFEKPKPHPGWDGEFKPGLNKHIYMLSRIRMYIEG